MGYEIQECEGWLQGWLQAFGRKNWKELLLRKIDKTSGKGDFGEKYQGFGSRWANFGMSMRLVFFWLKIDGGLVYFLLVYHRQILLNITIILKKSKINENNVHGQIFLLKPTNVVLLCQVSKHLLLIFVVMLLLLAGNSLWITPVINSLWTILWVALFYFLNF